MTTTFSTLDRQQISGAALQELLGSQGPAYEAIGAGVQQALTCLADAEAYYDLPPELGPELKRFATHCQQALNALADAQALMH